MGDGPLPALLTQNAPSSKRSKRSHKRPKRSEIREELWNDLDIFDLSDRSAHSKFVVL
jgi:hypothetical protein